MKKILLIAVCFFGLQTISESQTKNYWIVFKDKNYNSFTINEPQKFLSQRSIERRINQNIKITSHDLPLSDLYLNVLISNEINILKKSKWFNAVLVECDENKLQLIQSFNFVKSVKQINNDNLPLKQNKFELEEIFSPVSIHETTSNRTPIFNYGLSLNQANQIGADCMHANGYTGQGVVVAVLDAGFFNVNILPAFDSLRMNNQLLGCRDFVTGDTLVYEDNQHGMMVLSTMVGNIPGRIVGTAPKAKYWLLRTEEAATETIQEEINWLVGAEFADSVGADIINSSLGYSYFDNPADNHTYADMDGNTTIITNAADWAASKGIFVCSSAGNSAGPPWYKITAPADADSILTVGAVDSAGFATGFSSRGPTFDGRIKPNVAAKGYQSVIAAPWGDIQQGNGTSFSSPITAGAVACLRQANPTKTNMELLYAIQQSANQASSPDTLIGYGIPNFCIANSLLTSITENILTENLFDSYPNPFSSNLNISYYAFNSEKIKISFYDITGRLVLEQQFLPTPNALNTIELKGFEKINSGIYFITMSNSTSLITTKKIIKN